MGIQEDEGFSGAGPAASYANIPPVRPPGILLALGLLAALGGPAGAQDTSRVAPDRPDITNSPETVPARALQLETGLEYARTSPGGAPAERRRSLQASLRAGLTDRLELRLDGEPVVHLRNADDHFDVGDLALGLKWRFADGVEGRWWPSLGVQPFVKIPTAGPPAGSGRADFGLLALAGLDLPWRVGLDLNAGLVAIGQRNPEGYLLQALVSGSLSRPLAERVVAFVELFFSTRTTRDDRDALGLGAGLLSFLTPRVALDLAVQTSLFGRLPDYALRVGLSARWGR